MGCSVVSRVTVQSWNQSVRSQVGADRMQSRRAGSCQPLPNGCPLCPDRGRPKQPRTRNRSNPVSASRRNSRRGWRPIGPAVTVSIWRNATTIFGTGSRVPHHWSIAGAILAITGAAPDHWLAELWREIPFPREAVPLWLAHLDYRLVAVVAGLTIVVGDTLWRHHRQPPPVAIASPSAPSAPGPGKPRDCRTGHRSRSCRSPT